RHAAATRSAGSGVFAGAFAGAEAELHGGDGDDRGAVDDDRLAVHRLDSGGAHRLGELEGEVRHGFTVPAALRCDQGGCGPRLVAEPAWVAAVALALLGVA